MDEQPLLTLSPSMAGCTSAVPPSAPERPGAAVPGHNCKMIDCPVDPTVHLKSLGIGLESILRGLNTPVLNSN